MELHKRIKKARENKGLTQFELAVKSEVQPNTVSNWERGNIIPSKLTLMALSQILETDLL